MPYRSGRQPAQWSRSIAIFAGLILQKRMPRAAALFHAAQRPAPSGETGYPPASGIATGLAVEIPDRPVATSPQITAHTLQMMLLAAGIERVIVGWLTDSLSPSRHL